MAVLTKITSRTLADNSVTSAKIQAGAVAAADVGTNAITAVELADDAVDTAAIADDAITYVKMQNLATGNRVLGAAASGVIGEVQVATAMIADDAVGAAAIADGAIDAAAKISDDAITGGKLANDIAISTSGNIATSGTGTLTVAGASNFASIATGTLADAVVFPAGHILQIQFAEKKDAQYSTNSYADSNWTDATGLSINITPSSATNYLWIQSNCHGHNEFASYGFGLRLYISGGGTDGAILIGDSSGSRTRMGAGGPTIGNATHGLQNYGFGGRIRCNDSTPNWSSGALTIKVQFATNNTAKKCLFNRAGNEADNSGYSAPHSSLTVMEIKG